MLLSNIINFLSSIIHWVNKDVPTNTTYIMMCSNDIKTADTVFLYHAINKSEENLKSLNNSCSCSISSEQPFTIDIKRHMILRSNTQQEVNNLTLRNGNQEHILDLVDGINPFGTDCLYGSKEDCHMFNSTNNSLIIDLEESASFREFIFKIYGTEEIQLQCNMTTINQSVSQSKPQNNEKSQTEDQSQDEPILYIGIILICLALIVIITTLLVFVWKTNPNLRHSIKRRRSKKNIVLPEEKVINEKVKIESETEEDMYEEMPNAGSPDEDDKYEFCEIEENLNHGQKSDIQPPKIPSTPFPTKQLPFFEQDKSTLHIVEETKDENCHLNSNATNTTMDSTQMRDNIRSEVNTTEEDPSYDHIESQVLKDLINTDDETMTCGDNNQSSNVEETKDEHRHLNSNATNTTMDSTQMRNNIQSEVNTTEEDPSYDHIESQVLKDLINTDDETMTCADKNRSSITENVNEIEAGLRLDKFQSPETLESVTAYHNDDSGSIPQYYTVEDTEDMRDNYQYDNNVRRETKSAHDLADHRSRAPAPIFNRSKSKNDLKIDKTVNYKDVMKELKKSLGTHDNEEASLDETGCKTDTRYGDMIILENELYQSLDSYDATELNNTPITHL